MPLQLPDLDDRTYTDLVEEALGMIPTYAGERWTDHNASDPGITLIELFAYLTEMLLYRLNRVTDDQVSAFLKLLNGPGWSQPKDKTLDQAIRDTILQLRQPDRAITCADFETLAQQVAPGLVQRVQCVPQCNLEVGPDPDHPGHVSVIVHPAEALLFQIPGRRVERDTVLGAFEANNIVLSSDVKKALDEPPHSALQGAKARVEKYGDREWRITDPASTLRYALRIEDDVLTAKLKKGERVLFRAKGVRLNRGKPTDGDKKTIREVFNKNQIRLSNTAVHFYEPDANEWQIEDKGSPQTYTVRAQADMLNFFLNLEVREMVQNCLEPRRPLATRVHVVGPRWVTVRVRVTLGLEPDYTAAKVHEAAKTALIEFFDPLNGGPDRQGWPFGRAVYVSEVYKLLNDLEGVDYVTKTADQPELVVEDDGRLELKGGQPVGVRLFRDELVDFQLRPGDITCSPY
jgi:hypothetical protein